MNLKKLIPIWDHLPNFHFLKNKVVSGFGLGLVSFFIVLCVVFFNLNPILNNPMISWSFTKLPSINSTSGDGSFGNYSNDLKNASFEKVLDLKGTHLGDSNGGVKNGSFDSNSEKNYSFDDTHLGNLTRGLKNGSFDVVFKNHSSSYEECDIFGGGGRWVRDDTKPYYRAGSCPYIDRDFDCHVNKRPDDGYEKWKWQPFGCEIPSLNATDFLERIRGQKLVFVGDSLNRNMWESLVCILRESISDKRRVYEISGKHAFKKKGFYAFRFEDYNCTIDFVGSPFLVRESSFNGKNGSFETLRLDLMDKTTKMYHDADVLVFNSGHWWTHEKTSRGENYYQEGDYVHPKLTNLEAYKKALSTWARWVDKNIDINKTQVIFRGYSPAHFKCFEFVTEEGSGTQEDNVTKKPSQFSTRVTPNTLKR